ncbi:MAG: SURF1 family protein [Pseudomonadota bacterium]|nr:SURF1 family protein [Pseudomonadota bacterium]
MSRQHHTLVIGWIATLVLVTLFCLLGHWQWRRMHEKQAMLAAVAQVIDARRVQPLLIAADPARSKSYDWAGGAGHFIDTPAWLLDNQQRDGQPGVRVFRLFAVAGMGTPLLVEMGWVPISASRELPELPAMPGGAIDIHGLLLPPPSRGLLAAAASETAAGHLVIGLDPATIAATLGVPAIAPRILRLDPALPLGQARDLDVLPNTLPPEKHLGYSVQWFALAAAIFIIAIVLTLRSRRRHHE